MGRASDDEEILRRPEALPIYREVKRQHWVAVFLQSSSHVFRRLGAQLVMDEVACAVDSERARLQPPRKLPPGRARGTFTVEHAVCACCARRVQRFRDGGLRGHRANGAPCPGGGPCLGVAA